MAFGARGQGRAGGSPPRPELKMAGPAPSDFSTEAGGEAGGTLYLWSHCEGEGLSTGGGGRQERRESQRSAHCASVMALPTGKTVTRELRPPHVQSAALPP